MTLGPVLAAGAGFAAAGGIVELAASMAARRRGRVAARVIAALVALGRRVGAPAPREELARRLEAAGTPLRLGATDMTAIKAGGALVALLAGAPLAATLPGRLPVAALVALPAAGFLLPDILLARHTRARARAMEVELPDLLDLLRVSIEAGLPIGRAVGEVARRHHGPLAHEWRAAAAELALGVARHDAMRRLVRRCPIAGMSTLAASIERAERHGAPLADTLAAQTHEARTARARRIREQAAKAAPKIQLVVALLLVPSVMLVVAAALVASLTGAR
jgi:tight adherence protein C